jgi:hypothetical protein
MTIVKSRINNLTVTYPVETKAEIMVYFQLKVASLIKILVQTKVPCLSKAWVDIKNQRKLNRILYIKKKVRSNKIKSRFGMNILQAVRN